MKYKATKGMCFW